MRRGSGWGLKGLLQFALRHKSRTVYTNSVDIESEIALIAKINEATKDIPDEETRIMSFKALLAKTDLGGTAAPAKHREPKAESQDSAPAPNGSGKKA